MSSCYAWFKIIIISKSEAPNLRNTVLGANAGGKARPALRKFLDISQSCAVR